MSLLDVLEALRARLPGRASTWEAVNQAFSAAGVELHLDAQWVGDMQQRRAGIAGLPGYALVMDFEDSARLTLLRLATEQERQSSDPRLWGPPALGAQVIWGGRSLHEALHVVQQEILNRKLGAALSSATR
jgi:hypothetical protein